MEPTACFVSASRQNVFFAELIDALAAALAEHGVRVERCVDYFPTPRDGLAYIFVPHELLPLLMPDAHPSDAQLRRSVTICTEQPGTHWFEQCVQASERACRTVDINRLGVAALNARGVDARFMQLGYTPVWDAWGGDPDSARPVDVAFLAGSTPRRLEAVAHCAPQLAGRRTELHLPEAFLPHRGDSDLFLSGARKWELLRSSKILINIHRGELGYFEWQRAIEAMVNGCVLLTEHSLGFEPLVPGEHLVSVSLRSLDMALEALLNDPDELSRIRAASYEFLRDELPLSSSIEVLADAVIEAAARPADSRLGATNAVPRPKPLELPPPEWERLREERSELATLRMAAKQLLLDQREMRKSLRELQLEVAGDVSRQDMIEHIGRPRCSPPRVSVVVTVYNYAGVVGAAIDSVAASGFTDYELVIVDDASTDDSSEAIRAAIDCAPWLSVKLVTRPYNRGLAAARNLGAEISEGDLLFILDADNAIYPHTLGRLVRALDETPTAMFAYGIIEQFSIKGPTGLVSYLGWDPVRLRYGNFVDAMAMVRRSALLDVGGYISDPRLYGWEDFALWCSFADRGWSGVRVPEIIARYRVGLHSMISVTNIDASAAWSLLLDRFECLSSNVVA